MMPTRIPVCLRRTARRLAILLAAATLATGCSNPDVSDGTADGWHPDDRPDAAPDGTDVGADTEPDTRPDTTPAVDSGADDISEPDADTGRADTSIADSSVADAADLTGDTSDPGPDASGPGLVAEAVAGDPWYGVTRLTQTPAVTGTIQKVTFDADKSVAIGVRGAVTGKWRIFDDDSVLLYELERADGSMNQPSQFVVEAELENDHLVAFEIFIGEGPDDKPYKQRFEQLETPDIAYDSFTGQWQSPMTYTDPDSNRDYRLALRVEEAGAIEYGAFFGRFVGFSRGDGHTITFDTGETFWFIAPPAMGMQQPPLAGEVRTDAAGELQLFAPRGIDEDGMEGPESFEAIEMESVESFSL